MYGWCPARLTRHSRRAPCARALPTRTHTHLPQHKQHLGHTTPGGPCKELPPPTRSGRDPGTRSGSRHRAAQPCLAVPLGGWQECRSPKPCLLYAADVPPALGWCSVWGHPSAGHPSAPIQGSALSSALPSILRSQGVGAAQPDGLQEAIKSGGQLFWPRTKVTEREVTGQQCLWSYFNTKRENFQPSSGQGGAATISRAGVWSKDQMHCWGNA